jgi:hypothetical protein
MLPSLYLSGDKSSTWNVTRAAVYGAGLGALAALLKTLLPMPGRAGGLFLANIPQIAGAALGIALLCAGAAALRNFIAQRLIWPEAQ